MSAVQIADKVRSGDESFVSSLSEQDWVYLQTAKDDDGRTCLHTVAACGKLQLLQTFLEHGCGVCVNKADEDGWTPLLSAASGGHEGTIQLLLGAGADASAVNSTERSALHYAASKGHVRVAQILIEAGASVNATDTVGATPLHRACSNSCAPMIEMLLKAGAHVAAVDKAGNTPLHVAVTVATDRASAEAAFALVRHGADLYASNNDEETPIKLAGENAAALEAVAAEGSDAMQA
eukprot:jgi/Ulvmu1/5339/UM022_0133.1